MPKSALLHPAHNRIRRRLFPNRFCSLCFNRIQHAPVKVVPRLQYSFHPCNSNIAISSLELNVRKLHLRLVAFKQLEELLHSAPSLHDVGTLLAECPEPFECCEKIVLHLCCKLVRSLELGTLVAHGPKILNKQLIGERVDDKIPQRAVNAGDKLLHIVFESCDDRSQSSSTTPV